MDDRETARARIGDASADTGFARRPLLRRTLLTSAGLFAGACGLLGIGGFVRDPWKGGAELPALRMTGWQPLDEETVYLRATSGVFGEITLVRPADMEPGSMLTVYPFRDPDRGQEELLLAAEQAADSPVMLIRLHPGVHVNKRPGQENFNYGISTPSPRCAWVSRLAIR